MNYTRLNEEETRSALDADFFDDQAAPDDFPPLYGYSDTALGIIAVIAKHKKDDNYGYAVVRYVVAEKRVRDVVMRSDFKSEADADSQLRAEIERMLGGQPNG